MGELVWVEQSLPKEDVVASLSSAINVHPKLASLLVQKGITDFDQAKAFFRPELSQLHDPFLMKDMDFAVNRINEAISKNEKILIYGDYDVDGTTSVSTFYGFLSRYYQNCDYYIPDRYKEGYGVSDKGIDYAIHHDFKLIISIDCGVKAVEKISRAKASGVDFIVCDHHKPGSELPPAIAVLDPKRDDCHYPYKELCGCGVGFKLLQAWCIQNDVDEENLFEFLDFVAIGTASDIVPITGENRILVYHGIQRMTQNPRPGIKALIETAGYSTNSDLTVSNIVFGIGPRINAAGRLDHAHSAVEVLLEEEEEKATTLAFSVNRNNSRRKNLDKEITRQAIDMIEADKDFKKAKSTVLFNESWHKGVIGIVASRCIETYYRPTIILTESNGMATGSARSVLGYDVYEAITACSGFLEQYGGHTYAAGLTMKIENIPLFREAFEGYVSQTISEEQLTATQTIDLELSLIDIDAKFYRILSQMGPFGPGNMQPVFISRKVIAGSQSKIVGDDHLKLLLTQDNQHFIDGIAFRLGNLYPKIKNGTPFDICYCIEENEFRGQKKLQLVIKDIKLSK